MLHQRLADASPLILGIDRDGNDLGFSGTRERHHVGGDSTSELCDHKQFAAIAVQLEKQAPGVRRLRKRIAFDEQDRKSTRLNSSHSQISYAVFCLKKKKNNLEIVQLVYITTETSAA